MVRLTDCLDMTIAVDWVIKPQIKQKAIHFIQLIPFASSDNVAVADGKPWCACASSLAV